MEENKKTKITFWGTSEFAIPALTALLKNGCTIAAVITAPDKPVGRKQLLAPPPVKRWLMEREARSRKIKIFQPKKLDKDFMLQVSILMSDVFVVAAYGKIIPMDILALPKYEAINIHPSLLPRWRGPSPIQYTILNGDAETGVTIMKIDKKMDHGPIIATTGHQLPPANKPTYQELHDMLAKIGAELLIETLPKYIAGEIKPMPQDESRATYSKLLKKDDGHIDWSRPAKEIEQMIRAFTPWPGAYTFWSKNGIKLKIDILKANMLSRTDSDIVGTVFSKNGDMIIQTSDQCLEILKLRIEGKMSTDTKSFLNGYPKIAGQILT